MTDQFSVGEILAPTVAFGNLTAATVPRDLVVYFFEHERLPTKLGWTRKTESITLEVILRLSAIFGSSSSLLTVDSNATIAHIKRGRFHGIEL